MSRVCPDCGQTMVNGFLQTGGGTAAFIREPRTLLFREDRGDFRLPVSRLTKTCPVQADDCLPGPGDRRRGAGTGSGGRLVNKR